MKYIGLRYIHDYAVNGVTYVYYRRGDFQTPLPELDNPNFSREWHIADALYNSARTPNRLRPDGSLRWLAEAYFDSPEFKNDLEESTQKQKMSTWREILAKFGDWPYKRINRQHIKAIRKDKADVPTRANARVTELCCLFNWAIDNEYAKYNPASNIKKLKHVSDGFVTWTRTEITKYRAYWKVGTVERLMFEMYLCTAQRGGDVTLFGWAHVDGEYLIIKPRKTRKAKRPPTLTLKIDEHLRACLEHVPNDQEFFVVNKFGERYSVQAFQKRLVRAAKAAGLDDMRSGHGLRKAKLTMLAENGATTPELKAVSGHLTDAQLSPYIEKAERKRLADNAAKKFEDNEPELAMLNAAA